MDALIRQLGGLLLTAVPTIILLIIVHFYLKYMLFRPLHDVLQKRREATEGALQAAQKSLDLAAEKATMYDLALKEARAEMYRESEEARRNWLDQQAARIEEARLKTHEMIQEASAGLASEIEAAKRDLASRSQMLALQIVETIVAGRTR